MNAVPVGMLRTSFVVMACTFAGCHASPTPAAQASLLVGRWLDPDTGAILEFVGSEPLLRSIVDDDGEVYVVKDYGWDAGAYEFTYYVPSTDFTVDVRLTEFERDSVAGTWDNRQASGRQVLERTP